MQKGKLAHNILIAVGNAIESNLDLEVFLQNGTGVFYAREPTRKNLYSTVKRLSRQGYLEQSISEGKIILKLTNAGDDWVLRYGEAEPKNWDGVWRIVVFDIPEKHRLVRQTLRRRLKEWGFTPWQKSVWASKKPLTQHLRKLIKDLGVEQWVLVIESSNVGR